MTIMLLPPEIEAMRQLATYKAKDFNAKPRDGFIYLSWLVDVKLETSQALIGYDLLEPYRTSLNEKFEDFIRLTRLGREYVVAMGWVIDPPTPWLEDGGSTDFLDNQVWMWGYLTALETEETERIARKQFAAANIEMARIERKEFAAANVALNLTLEKRGAQLEVGDIIRNTTYGVWEIVIRVYATHVLVRNYNRFTQKVAGFTRLYPLKPNMTHQMLCEPPHMTTWVDWMGHMQSVARTMFVD